MRIIFLLSALLLGCSQALYDTGDTGDTGDTVVAEVGPTTPAGALVGIYDVGFEIIDGCDSWAIDASADVEHLALGTPEYGLVFIGRDLDGVFRGSFCPRVPLGIPAEGIIRAYTGPSDRDNPYCVWWGSRLATGEYTDVVDCDQVHLHEHLPYRLY